MLGIVVDRLEVFFLLVEVEPQSILYDAGNCRCSSWMRRMRSCKLPVGDVIEVVGCDGLVDLFGCFLGDVSALEAFLGESGLVCGSGHFDGYLLPGWWRRRNAWSRRLRMVGLRESLMVGWLLFCTGLLLLLCFFGVTSCCPPMTQLVWQKDTLFDFTG